MYFTEHKGTIILRMHSDLRICKVRETYKRKILLFVNKVL